MKRTLLLLLTLIFTLGMAGCDNEGPAEKAGKKIDQTVEKAGEKIEQAGDTIREKTDN